MMMVRISHVWRHETHANMDVAPNLKSLRTSDRGVGVAVQELLAMRLGACADLPVEPWFDEGEGIRQGADGTWLTARVAKCLCQMAADGQPSGSLLLDLA